MSMAVTDVQAAYRPIILRLQQLHVAVRHYNRLLQGRRQPKSRKGGTEHSKGGTTPQKFFYFFNSK